ncbi:MAG: metallophosphoesterase family protein [Gemmatimonadales bacterium]|nr:metallophosphoesterase family protein [Gemmatimonadales bacterium]
MSLPNGYRPASGVRITRRRFLAGVGASGLVVAADAFGFEAHRVLLTRHDVRIEGLASGLDGLRIAQISDVHFPGNRIAAQAALDLLYQERPDIVLLTGDMTESREAMKHVRSFVGEGRGLLATVAVLGNWEHRAGVGGQVALETYRSAGAELLVNRAMTIDIGGVPLTLVGLDDPVIGSPDLTKARESVVPGSTEIWLVHAPGYLDQPPANTPARPVLLLAGHTHGGQIRFPMVPPVKPTGAGRFLEGWYYDTFAPLYVSRGVRTTGIPARFLCPAELPVYTLRTA